MSRQIIFYAVGLDFATWLLDRAAEYPDLMVEDKNVLWITARGLWASMVYVPQLDRPGMPNKIKVEV
jgi:hypothetical protein